MRYQPGLDGLRAFAVVAVIFFHAEPSWLPAGFLGVDVFFVISGYLICTLVLVEHRRSGTVSFVAFWGRRARRLLPALYALLLAVSIAAVTFARDVEDGLFGDVLAALAYVSNWWLIAGDDTYFDTFGRPPLLRHLWSLAVEEQFYILFPICMAWIVRTWRARPPIAPLALAGAVVSTVWMAVLYTDGGDPSRVYYGTDTRMAGLLIGVALGAIWPMGELRHDLTRQQQRVVELLGWGSIVGLVLSMLLFREDTALLFRGGFLVVSLLAAVAVAMAVHPASRFGQILAWSPLLWIGTRSYALYLWHWPVLVLTAPETGDMRGGMPLPFQLAIVVVLAELSWRYVERPVRDGTLRRWWDSYSPTGHRWLAVGVTIPLLALGAALYVNRDADVPDLLSDGPTSVHPDDLPPLTSPRTTPNSAPTTQPGPGPTATTTPTPLGPMLAIGDSVMLGARDALAFASAGSISVDAAVSRQVDDGLDVLQGYLDSGDLDRFDGVIIHLGTNGPFTAEEATRLRDLIRDVDRVIVVNARVSQPWEGETNSTIGALAREDNVRVADWFSASGGGGVLEGDGVHPTPSGANVYARTIVEAARGFDG